MNKKVEISMIVLILFVICILTLFGFVIFSMMSKETKINTFEMDYTMNFEDVEIEEEPIVESTSIEGKYDHEVYEEKIKEIAKKYNTSGISVALVDEGKVIDTFSTGSAIKNKLEMTENTKIRIASLSKVFLGIATMISVENGTMSLDEDIGTYWGFKIKTIASGDVITPRTILTHTSSIISSDVISHTYYSNMANRLKTGTGIRNIVSGNIKNYSYNNYAIDVLGMTVELANNKNIDKILSENLYNDMNIDAAYFGGDLKDTSNIATIYRADGSVGKDASTMVSWHSGEPASKGWAFAGGVTISTKDLGKIVAMLANNGVYDGKRYLSEDVINWLEYHEGNELIDHWQCQPLCYKQNEYGQEEIYYHTGSAYGLYSLMAYNPNTKQGVAIVTTGSNSKDIIWEIAEVLLNIEKESEKYEQEI